MYQQPAALDMAQKVVTKSGALRRALDKSGDIGADEALALMCRDDSELRLERSEAVVRDLRASRADYRQKRRLSDIRKSDESDVGEHL